MVPHSLERAWPYQHLDFRLLAFRTVKQSFSVVLSHLDVLLCYGHSRKLMQSVPGKRGNVCVQSCQREAREASWSYGVMLSHVLHKPCAKDRDFCEAISGTQKGRGFLNRHWEHRAQHREHT